MAAHRSFLRCSGALAIGAAIWLLALQMFALAAMGTAPGVAAVGHFSCVSAPHRDGTPPAHPGRGADCDSCLLCQHRGAALVDLAFAPPETQAEAPRREGADAPAFSPVEPAERRAGRGHASSRAPPAVG